MNTEAPPSIPVWAIMAEIVHPHLFRAWLLRQADMLFYYEWGEQNPLGIYLRENSTYPHDMAWYCVEWPTWVHLFGFECNDARRAAPWPGAAVVEMLDKAAALAEGKDAS